MYRYFHHSALHLFTTEVAGNGDCSAYTAHLQTREAECAPEINYVTGEGQDIGTRNGRHLVPNKRRLFLPYISQPFTVTSTFLARHTAKTKLHATRLLPTSYYQHTKQKTACHTPLRRQPRAIRSLNLSLPFCSAAARHPSLFPPRPSTWDTSTWRPSYAFSLTLGVFIPFYLCPPANNKP